MDFLQADAFGTEGRDFTGSYRQRNAAAASYCELSRRSCHALLPTAHSAIDAVYEQSTACCQTGSDRDFCGDCQASPPGSGELSGFYLEGSHHGQNILGGLLMLGLAMHSVDLLTAELYGKHFFCRDLFMVSHCVPAFWFQLAD